MVAESMEAGTGAAQPEAAQQTASEQHIVEKPESLWATAALLAGVGLFLYLVRQILPPFVVGAVLAYIFAPMVGYIERRARLPRALAILSFLFLLLGPLVALGWLVEPALVGETKDLATNTPAIINNLSVQLFGGQSFSLLGQTVDAPTVADYLLGFLLDFMGTPAQAIHVAASAVEIALDSFLSLVLLFYFLLDPKRFGEAILRLVPLQHRPQLRTVGREINLVLARYFRGLLFLVVLMSSVTWIGLAMIFHLPYSLPIAIATGFLEIIPFLGPVLAASIASVVALSHGGTNLALAVALFYLVLRQLEDQLVMPAVIGRAVEIYPAVAIFAVLAGGALGGVLGALLGIPVAAAVKVAFDRWRPL